MSIDREMDKDVVHTSSIVLYIITFYTVRYCSAITRNEILPFIGNMHGTRGYHTK